MKLRNREVNVFSMSALDLFASAMGAFMLLAIMALPFFPNTGDSPEKVAEIKKELEQAEAELKKEKEEKESIQKELDKEKKIPKTAFPSMDIVIALDTTGSMENQVVGLRKEIIQLAELLMKLSPDAAMGIIEFKDRCDKPTIRSQQIVKLSSSSIKQLQGFANNMRARSGYCNQDYEEALDRAMDTAVGMSWRSSSRAKHIIFISDNGAYLSKENSTLAKARTFKNAGPKNQISTVFVRTDNASKRFLELLAKEGGGNFVTNRSSFTATILLALAE